MHLHEVALRRLDGRRDLDLIHVAGFNLGLHQKIQDAIKFLADDSKISDLILQDDRLLMNRLLIHDLLQPFDPEKRACFVSDLSSFRIVMPVLTGIIIRNLSD